jgi:hypothetical protein
MQTTLRIQDDIYREAKAEAAREGISMTRFLESALRMRLGRSDPDAPKGPHPFPVHVPVRPLALSTAELKRITLDDELLYDMRKLRMEAGDA